MVSYYHLSEFSRGNKNEQDLENGQQQKQSRWSRMGSPRKISNKF